MSINKYKIAALTNSKESYLSFFRNQVETLLNSNGSMDFETIEMADGISYALRVNLINENEYIALQQNIDSLKNSNICKVHPLSGWEAEINRIHNSSNSKSTTSSTHTDHSNKELEIDTKGVSNHE
jgi:hypothetical protein